MAPFGFSNSRLGTVRCALAAWGILLYLANASFAESPQHISFRNDVMAVLSKGGCNSGPCHGNRSGKGGFKLSLRGEDPDADYAAITADLSARRIDRLDPVSSLLIAKPTQETPHEGRQRFAPDSQEARILIRWIAEGCKNDAVAAPTLRELRVTPAEHFGDWTDAPVPLRVMAHFSDGSSRDVTSMAVYEASYPSVNISRDGRVQAQQPGETTILVRFLDQQTAVPFAFRPGRKNFEWRPTATAEHPIDIIIEQKLRRLQLQPSPRASDERFIRRVYLDLLGQIPDAKTAQAWVADRSSGKRERLVDDLLERPEFAEFWALKWADLFRAEERSLDRKGAQAFHQWLIARWTDHTPLDVFARTLLQTRGSTYAEPAGNWFRSHRTPVERAEAAAQIFLGTRLQCAQCHNHPYERWSQNDYHDWTALFARVDYKVLENRRRDDNDKHEFIGEQWIYVADKGAHNHPRTGQPAAPRLLGQTQPVPTESDPMEALAGWLTRPTQSLFARAQANRIWFHLMGRGLVDPIDDFRSTNPASHPEALDQLARYLVDSGFDVRRLIRWILSTRAYQADSEPAPGNVPDPVNYSHASPRRLTAEQLLDSLALAAGVALDFPGYPKGTRASQIPGVTSQLRRGRKGTADLDRFLQTFGKPPRQLPTECERSNEPALSQALELMSGPVLHQLITAPNNRLQELLTRANTSIEEQIRELYWAALARDPSAQELQALASHIRTAPNPRSGFEDVLWTLTNAKEFVLRH